MLSMIGAHVALFFVGVMISRSVIVAVVAVRAFGSSIGVDFSAFEIVHKARPDGIGIFGLGFV